MKCSLDDLDLRPDLAEEMTGGFAAIVASLSEVWPDLTEADLSAEARIRPEGSLVVTLKVYGREAVQVTAPPNGWRLRPAAVRRLVDVN